MKKIYVAPQTEIVVMSSCAICAASGNAGWEVDKDKHPEEGIGGGITGENGGESDAKGGNFDLWEE